MSKEQPVEHTVLDSATEVVDEIQHLVDETEQRVEAVVKPIRKSVFSRFPVLFLLLITFGVTATLTGIEQILLQYQLLQNYPWLIFIMGIVTLGFTGTLYKKLG